MYCVYCGEPLGDHFDFCTNCGEEAFENQKARKKRDADVKAGRRAKRMMRRLATSSYGKVL